MGHFKLKIFFVGFIILLGNNNSNAQEITGIENLTEVNESFQKINEIQQDSTGNLWLATKDDVQRYNSFFSEFYTQFKGMPEKSGSINTILIDTQNRIWVGTENGLYLFDAQKNIFKDIPSERANTKTNVQQIVEDDSGKIWIGSYTGIWNYTRNQLVLISPFPSKQSVNELIAANQQIIFGTSKGLFGLNKNSGQYKKIPLASNKDFNVRSIIFTGENFLIGTKENGLYKTNGNFKNPEKVYSLPYTSQNLPIDGISMDKNGNVYIASNGDGLVVLNKNLQLSSHYLQQGDNALSLSDNNLNGLYLDKYNTLWVSTESGQINSINLKQNNFEFLRHDPRKYSSLADNFTTAIEEDKNGNVWFGTRQGLSVWNKQADSWRNFKNLSSNGQSKIPDIIRDLHADDMHMWIATFNDGVYKIHINTFTKEHYSPDGSRKTGLKKANALLVDTNNNVWAGGEDGNLTRISSNGNIKSFTLRDISAMAQLSTGNILAAGRNGVFNIHTGANEFQAIKRLDPNTKNLPYFNINAISESLSGEIVFATEGAGIVIYDPEKGSVQVVDEKSGLPSNRIQGLLIYGRNEVWAGTSKGLVSFMIEDEPKIRVFDKEDGLLSAVFTRGSFAQIDNKLAFGTLKGVSVFNPNRLKSKPETVPNILFGSLNIFDKSKNRRTTATKFNAKKKWKLEPDQNSFQIKFYGMFPGNFSQLAYSWKLEGLESAWSEPSMQNEASYANLAPGNYRFLVKGKKPNGQWSPVQELSINIASPWWASNGAYLLYALAIGLLIGIPLYLYRIHKRREDKATRTKFYTNLNQEIGTPLTILLTSLNNIAEEEKSKNKHRLTNTVVRLKELLEPILNFQPSRFNKINPNPKITKISLNKYFEEIKKDFAPLLLQKHLEIIVNNQWNQEFFFYDADNLNKIFFNLMSNAIKYSFDEGKIIINLISTNKGDLKIQIADNGVGLPRRDQKVIKEYYRSNRTGMAAESSEQINLLFVKDFIDKLGGTIVFESSKNQGTTFTLILKNHINDIKQETPFTEDIILEESEPENDLRSEVVQSNLSTTKVVPIAEESERLEKEVLTGRESTSEEIRILIVEDNDELRKVFVRSLKKLGEVFDAKNGMEAYELADRIIPNAIIADFDMPGMDGVTLFNAFKQNPDLNKIPVFLMITDEDRLQLPAEVQSEMLHFMVKPVDLEHLLQKLEEVLTTSISQPFINTRLSQRNSDLLKGGLDDKFLENLEVLILQNIENTAYAVEDLCEAIGMSSNSLYLKLKNLNGLTPLDFIMNTKLGYAKSLIKRGESDLAEVARQAGFQNKDIFFSSFRKHFGFMPGTIMVKNSPES